MKDLAQLCLVRSGTLSVYFEQDLIHLYNFATKSGVACPSSALDLLVKFGAPNKVLDVIREFPNSDPRRLLNQIIELIEIDALLIEGSDEHLINSDFLEKWKWSHACALFHFTTRETEFISNERAIELQIAKARLDPSPPLFERDDPGEGVNLFPKPKLDSELFASFGKRRSVRSFNSEPISLQCLSDVLFSGLGIIGKFEDPEICDLPVKLTPSGGARNPYEAYVYSMNVKGLTRGLYHYSASNHVLSKRVLGTNCVPSRFLGNQEWVDDAAAIIFLVANFPRTMWKYPDNNAYRVVLIEAGHIGQNMCLAAGSHGKSSVPTSAINDREVEKLIGFDRFTCCAISAIVVGSVDRALDLEFNNFKQANGFL